VPFGPTVIVSVTVVPSVYVRVYTRGASVVDIEAVVVGTVVVPFVVLLLEVVVIVGFEAGPVVSVNGGVLSGVLVVGLVVTGVLLTLVVTGVLLTVVVTVEVPEQVDWTTVLVVKI
jgi:hypothetical protein